MLVFESFLIGIGGSLAADWISRGGQWVLKQKPVTRSIEMTARRYRTRGEYEVRAALNRWIEGGAFLVLLSEIKGGAADAVADRFVRSFKEDGHFEAVDPDGSHAADVVRRFVSTLRQQLLLEGDLSLLDQRVDKGFGHVLDSQEKVLDNQEEMKRMLRSLTPVDSHHDADEVSGNDLDAIVHQLWQASNALTSWPRTLDGRWIERPELDTILERIGTEATSVTLVEGEPGTGKSSLLAELAIRLHGEGSALLALKTDALPSDVKRAGDLVEGVPGGLARGIQALTRREPVVVVLDQLDALSDVSDVRSERLNAVLDLVGWLGGVTGVHIVASVRPFERAVDARLQGAFRDIIELPTLPWEEVGPILDEHGHNPTTVGPALRTVLRVPAYLGVFLDVAEPGATYVSWLRLYEDLWAKRVRSAPYSSEKLALIRDLVGWMGEREELWAPSALGDDAPEAFDALVRADVLTPEPARNRIGFRHQTLFEFARARAFVRGDESLVEHVRRRQDGLFVRPVLVAGLLALREHDDRGYEEAVETFLGAGFRDHVRTLVMDFLARQATPTDAEVRVLSPLLRDQEEGSRLLRFTSQSPGWFLAMVRAGILREWMRRPVEEAGPTLSVLVPAARRGEGETVFHLVERHWLSNPEYDALSLSALDEIPRWTAAIAAAVSRMLARLHDPFRHHAVEVAFRGDVPWAFRLLRRVLDLDYDDARASEPPTWAGEGIPSELAEALRRERARDHVVREWHRWPLVVGKVSEAPEAFFGHVWPWFEGALTDAPATKDRGWCYRRPLASSSLDDDADAWQRSAHGVAGRLLSALASTDPALFEATAERIAQDDRQETHRALIEAYVATAEDAPGRALRYLLGDPRRMLVATFKSETGMTTALIEAVSPHLTDEDRAQLEVAIRAFAPPLPDGEDPERWERVTQRARLRLMRAVKDASAGLRAERDAAEAALPNLPDEDRSWSGFGAVVSPIPPETLAEMDREELVHVMDEALAGRAYALAETYLDEPTDPAFVGGVEELAGAFGQLAKQHPERVVALVDGLEVKYLPFAARMVGGLGEASGTEGEAVREALPRLVLSLTGRGFDSGAFRDHAASALMGAPSGLESDVLDLLQRWMWEAEPNDLVVTHDPNADRSAPLLFGDATWIEGGGRSRMLRAIAVGCFLRPDPDFARWMELVGRLAEEGPHPKTAASALRFSTNLFLSRNPDHERASTLVQQLVTSAPECTTYPEGLLGLSLALRSLEPIGAAFELVDVVRALNWDDAEQAYGELLFVLFVGTRGGYAEERVRECLSSPTEALRGLAYAAVHFWELPFARPLALDVLKAAAASRHAEVAAIPGEIFRSFLWGSKPRVWVPEDVDVIDAILASDLALAASADGALSVGAARVRDDSALACRIGRAVTEAVLRGLIRTGSGRFWRLDEPLTQLALTLHRSDDPEYRAAGLDLFESVYRLGLRKTLEAVALLDRSVAV